MSTLGHAEQLKALVELQRNLALESDIDRVLERIASASTLLLDASRATLYVVDPQRNELWSRAITESELGEIRLPLDGRSIAAEVVRTGALLRIADAYGDVRFDPSVDARSGYRTQSLLVVPIDSRGGDRLGVLEVVNRKEGPFRADQEPIATALAAAAGIALEYVALARELAAERLRVVRIAEETRHRLARDLHDGVAQTLANAAIGIELVQKRATTDVPAALAELHSLRERLVASQGDLRDILFALRPVALEQEGLSAAARALVERLDGVHGSHVALRRGESARRLPPEVEAGAFTVIREAANNAIKTGRAPNVAIDVFDDDGAVVAAVEDDGVGFDVQATLADYAARGSLGLLQMRESARLIGAHLEIDSAHGQGTRIRLRIPAR